MTRPPWVVVLDESREWVTREAHEKAMFVAVAEGVRSGRAGALVDARAAITALPWLLHGDHSDERYCSETDVLSAIDALRGRQ